MTQIRTYVEALMLIDESPLRLAPGQVLFQQGDESDGKMYVVRTGSVELKAGRRSLESVGPGGMIGEMALIDPAPRSATAVAGADCTVTAVNQSTFHELVRRVPGLALEVMKIMARRLRAATAAQGAPAKPKAPRLRSGQAARRRRRAQR